MKLTAIICVLVLAACSSAPKKPRYPDDATRVPINQTVKADMRASK